MSVVLTTHYMEEATRLCDRLVIVDHGKILVEGSPAELILKHAGRNVIEIGGPDQALRDYLKANQVAYDDLGQRLILFSPGGKELSEAVRDNFCHEQCTFRNGSLGGCISATDGARVEGIENHTAEAQRSQRC